MTIPLVTIPSTFWGDILINKSLFNTSKIRKPGFSLTITYATLQGATNPTATNSSSKWALESFYSLVYNMILLADTQYPDHSGVMVLLDLEPIPKYGNFASVSAGWTLSNESFFPENDGPISFAKLRFSWGQTGNNQIGNFASIAQIGQDNYVLDGSLEAGSFHKYLSKR